MKCLFVDLQDDYTISTILCICPFLIHFVDTYGYTNIIFIYNNNNINY
jgi:hypothetical protein